MKISDIAVTVACLGAALPSEMVKMACVYFWSSYLQLYPIKILNTWISAWQNVVPYFVIRPVKYYSCDQIILLSYLSQKYEFGTLIIPVSTCTSLGTALQSTIKCT